MSYIIIIENKAQKDFLKLSPPFDTTVKKHIDALEKDPRPHGVKKLSGSDDSYRIRIGDYRILYSIDDRRKVISIFRIRHRREVYQ
jgi:mRNA interferase RelE/StbE